MLGSMPDESVTRCFVICLTPRARFDMIDVDAPLYRPKPQRGKRYDVSVFDSEDKLTGESNA